MIVRSRAGDRGPWPETFAVENIDVLGHLLAYAIAGHHSGLLDGRGPGSCLEARLAKTVESWRSAAQASLVATQNLNPPPPPDFIADALGRRDAFCVAFFVRMLFSCLVDADYAERELTVRLQLWREPESKNGIIYTRDWGKKIDSPSTWGGTWVDTATWVSHETVVQIESKTSMDDKEVAVLVEHAVLKEKKALLQFMWVRNWLKGLQEAQ